MAVNKPTTNILRILAYLATTKAHEKWKGYETGRKGGLDQHSSPFELFVKDLFCGIVGDSSEDEAKGPHGKLLSFLGSKNHPPDFIIRHGDAVEVKRVQSPTSPIQLNSSFPKQKLFSNDIHITQECRDCEGEDGWSEKDLFYVVGYIEKGTNLFKQLWIVQGECYAANSSVYESEVEKIKKSLGSDVNTETNELGRKALFDPREATTLRLRGIWMIETPRQFFREYVSVEANKGFTAVTILTKDKYDSMPKEDVELIEQLGQNGKISIQDVKLRSPDQEDELCDAKIIVYIP